MLAFNITRNTEEQFVNNAKCLSFWLLELVFCLARPLITPKMSFVTLRCCQKKSRDKENGRRIEKVILAASELDIWCAKKYLDPGGKKYKRETKYSNGRIAWWCITCLLLRFCYMRNVCSKWDPPELSIKSQVRETLCWISAPDKLTRETRVTWLTFKSKFSLKFIPHV